MSSVGHLTYSTSPVYTPPTRTRLRNYLNSSQRVLTNLWPEANFCCFGVCDLAWTACPSVERNTLAPQSEPNVKQKARLVDVGGCKCRLVHKLCAKWFAKRLWHPEQFFILIHWIKKGWATIAGQSH